MMVKEIHHRVKNNLQIISSLLDLQSDDVNDPLVTRILQNSQSRVQSIALVHQKIYPSSDLTQVNVIEYLGILYKSGIPEIRIETSIGNFSLEIDVAVPLGLKQPPRSTGLPIYS